MDGAILTLVHMTCCILLLIFSFLIIAPLAVLLRNFDGHCIAGANISLELSAQTPFKVEAHDVSGAGSHCVYPEVMGFFILFFSIIYIVWNSCLLFNTWQSSWRDSFLGTCFSGLITFLLLVASAVISASINRLCGILGNGQHRCSSLDNYTNNSWLSYKDISGDVIPSGKLHVTGFYTLLKIAEVGCWLSFVVFFILLITYLMKLKSSSSGESFLDNLNRERERIADSANQRRYDQI